MDSRPGATRRPRRAFAAVGQMAVTNYLAHSLACGVLFIGLRWYWRLQPMRGGALTAKRT